MSEQEMQNQLDNLHVGRTDALNARDKALVDLEAAKKAHADALADADERHKQELAAKDAKHKQELSLVNTALVNNNAQLLASTQQLADAAKQLADIKTLHGKFLASIQDVAQSQLGQDVLQQLAADAAAKKRAELWAELAKLRE